MAKEISGFVKLQCKGGQANPAPPIGPALGSKGINIMEFCKQFNARTQDRMGKVLPVLITVYSDKSFDFIIKTPPASIQLLEAAKIQKGSKPKESDLTVHVFFQPLHSFISQVFIKFHQPVDNAVGSQFYYTVGNSLHKSMVMTG